MYRLHIDIPIDESELGNAQEQADKMVGKIYEGLVSSNIDNLIMNYRLGHDSDRQKSNYLMINENGHANNKKCRISIDLLDSGHA